MSAHDSYLCAYMCGGKVSIVQNSVNLSYSHTFTSLPVDPLFMICKFTIYNNSFGIIVDLILVPQVFSEGTLWKDLKK